MLAIYMKKKKKNSTTESQDRRSFNSARAICNFHSCLNFALVLNENALVFSLSDPRNCFMNIITNHTGSG